MINPQILEDLKALDDDGSNAILKELITLYLETTPPKLQKMEETFKAQDVVALRKEAHSLKSSSQNLGAETLGALAFKIESSKDGDALAPLLDAVLKEFAVVKTELEQFL